MEPAPRTRLLAGLVAITALVALTLASLFALLPPTAKSADAPADEFSATRAFQHVRTIGENVHVTGSAAADQVREHIVETMTDLGYSPQVREGIGQTDALGGPAMAHVRDVVTEIPGSDSTTPLILMAHYDSVQVSYGANDDGSGVAVLLETARALATGPQLRNDVVILFTDAEEACLCGAESFVDSDPLGVDGGVVLNFESRGSSGPPVMFETATGNAGLVAEYAAAVPYPVATSMAVEVYRILPNDTDFTPFLDSGRFTGLNSAYIDGSAVYHSPEDRPEYMDTGTLQAHGDNALAMARQLGNADIGDLDRPASYDATYFPVLGSLMMYPGWLVWPLAILALLAVAGLALMVHERMQVGWRRISTGFGLMLVPLIGAAVVAQLLWALLVLVRPDYGSMIDPWRPGWYRVAVCALVAVVVLGWFALWRKRLTPWGLAVGALGWLAVLGVVMAIATPGGSYLPVLPALAGAIGGMVALRLGRWWLRLLVMTVSSAIAVLILAPTALLFFPALGVATGAAAALMVVMLLLAILPVLDYLHPAVAPLPGAHQDVKKAENRDRDDPAHVVTDGGTDSDAKTVMLEGARGADEEPIGPPMVGSPGTERPADQPRRRLAAAGPTLVAVALAVACTGIGLMVDQFDSRHPAPTQLMYALDADTDAAYWVSQQDDPSGWTANYVTGEQDLSEEFPMLHGTLATGQAEAASLPAPQLTVDNDVTEGSTRTLTVTVHPQRDVRLIDLSSADAVVRSATVQAGDVSREVHLGDGAFQLLFHAPPKGGVTVTMVLDGTGPVTFRVMDGSDGLTRLPGFVPRPANVGVQGSHTSELVLVAHSVTL